MDIFYLEKVINLLTDEDYDVSKRKGHLTMGFWAPPSKMYLSISFTVKLLLRKNDIINIKAITCKQYDH